MADRVPKSSKQVGQQRWRAGKVPEWAGGEGNKVARAAEREKEEDLETEADRPEIVHDKSDRRLRRLAEGRKEGGDTTATRHREVVEAEVLVGGDDDSDKEEGGGGRAADDSDEDEDEDAVEARRERLRAAAKRRAAEQKEEELPVAEEEEEDAGSSEWEYETDSEEEEAQQLVKPVFVPKTSRATIDERNKIDEEYEKLEAAEEKRKEERKKETRNIVAVELKKEQEAQRDKEKRKVKEDTDSGGDEEEEYDKWRLRELKRLKRDREEREKFEKEKLDVLRRRTMTDDQVMAEDQAMGKGKKKRGAMVFMQKYHHKGAFFMENDETNKFKEAIYNRDYNDATEEDKATSKLAEGPYSGSRVLQVRRGEFGKMGRTKYTHLADQDTTKQDSPWAASDTIRAKFVRKGGGMDHAKRPGDKRTL